MGLLKTSKGSAIVIVLVFSAIFLFFCGAAMKISGYILEQVENVSNKMEANYLAQSGLQLAMRKVDLDREYKKETWERCPILYKVEKNRYFIIKKVEKEDEYGEFDIVKIEIEGRVGKWSNKIETKLNVRKKLP
ncbi:MAG: hypothetical protein QMD92_05205 [bacterium]|nr:hypothetical protein [bacterium]